MFMLMYSLCGSCRKNSFKNYSNVIFSVKVVYFLDVEIEDVLFLEQNCGRL